MSCPKKNRDFYKKPKRSGNMVRNDQVYIWKEVMGNPNLYCWMPASKKTVNPINVNLDEVNIQDIPPPYTEIDDDRIAHIVEQVDKVKNKKLINKSDPDYKDLVSLDDPYKYPVVLEYIKDRGLKMYGGAAINYYLPKEEKIYNPRDIPDYDVFSPDPWKDAVNIANLLYKNGYKFVEVRSGIHKGTYKVYANLWPVADITYVRDKEYKKIKTKKFRGINIVSPIKLLEAMYKEFSEPYGNPGRWPKVIYREKLLTKWTNPFDKKFKCSENLFVGGIEKVNPLLAQLLESCYKLIIKKKLVFTAGIAYNTYIEVGGGTKRLLVDSFTVLSEHAETDVKELMDKLVPIEKKLEVTSRYLISQELNKNSYQIFVIIDKKYIELCRIVQLDNCTPYQTVLGRKIVSIDYLIYELLDTAVYGNTKEIITDAKCKIQYLKFIQNNYYEKKKITEFDKSPFQRLLKECIGPVDNRLKVEILNRWLERVARMEKIKKINTKYNKIRIYPRESIPEECKDLPKNSCTYPCAWNKYIKQCTGIPSGVYRPDEDEEFNEYEI